MEKLYDVAPGFDWVAGKRVPDSRQVWLTVAEAAFDLSLGRIRLATGQPLPEPDAPVKNSDEVTLKRGDLTRTATMADVGAFVREGAVEGDGVKEIVKLSQATYDALADKDPETLYVIPVA